jgi:hypothetical protein
VLHVEVGDNGDVVWTVTGRCHHSREDVYPQLKFQVPCAPGPRYKPNPERDALKDTMMAILTNKALTPGALRLAGLEALGIGQDQALDMLGITASSNRRRARLERDKALSPAATIKTDSKRRSKAPNRNSRGTRVSPGTGRPAETHLPAATIKTESPGLSKLIVAAGGEPDQKPPLTSTNGSLTTRATIVSGPAGTGTATSTELDLELALDLLRSELGAEVIATELRPSPHPVADIAEVWTPTEGGPCTLCGTTCCRYGDRGSPLCPDCQAAVRPPG